MIGRRPLMRLFLVTVFLLTGCSRIYEVVTSNPAGADIYWGKSADDMKSAGVKTTNSRSTTGSEWQPFCYQVKKEGYKDAEIVCRPEEGYRYVNFNLEPVATYIDSDPPGAIIYWGPSKDQLKETIYKTPHVEKNVHVGANWKGWYFQARKKGCKDSEIVFSPQSSKDRHISFKLEPAQTEKRK